MNDIIKIFTDKDEIEIKKTLKQLILEKFETELDDIYLIDEDSIKDEITEILQEIVKEEIEKIRYQISKKVKECFSNIKL